MATTIEGQDRVLATAQQIVKSLNINSNDAEDMIMILSSFDNRLSNINDLMSSTSSASAAVAAAAAANQPNPSIPELDVDPEFESAEQVILSWDSVNGDSSSSRHSSPWEDSPDEAAEYLAAVDSILQFIEEDLDLDPAVRDRAENALQVAMCRLEDEFRHVLIRGTVPLDSDRVYGSIRRVSLSFGQNDGEIEEFGDSFVVGDGGGYCHERGPSLGDDVFVELISADAVDELREIADRMIRAGYEKECSQAYSNVRRDVLDESMTILGVERLSIDEVQKIEWMVLDEKMKKWIQALKIVVRVLLSGEKRLCEQIFSESELTKEISFVETAKGCVMQLLTFGEAVAIGRRSSEKLFRILEMHDALVGVLPHLDSLFTDESGQVVCSEGKDLLNSLGEAAIGTFTEFENAIKGENSKKPIQNGGLHPLPRYVMNYVKLVVDYSDSLNALLEKYEGNSVQMQTSDAYDLTSMSPIARRLLMLISSLETNLEEKSRMYEDNALQCIFLMNNVLYIVQKVKESDLKNLLGELWIRKHSGKIRQWHTSYLRAAWSKALACLKDEGIGGSTSNASRLILKEKFKSFNACFEDIYRIQSAWKVIDPQLREELRISISEKVLPAYRAFLGRFGSQLESGKHAGKYIKYTADDLEHYLLDLFEGTPSILNHMRRKST